MGEHILETITNIDDAYIQSALGRLGYLDAQWHGKAQSAECEAGQSVSNEGKSVNVTLRKLLKSAAVFIGVAILAAMTTVATTMAFSEEFRTTVKEVIFEFFHVEGTSIIPELSGKDIITTENMYVEQDRSIIGHIIEGRYVHAPVSCNAREGVYVICSDEVEMKQGSHYDAYYEENGQFIKLNESTFSGEYEVLGNTFHIAFDWVTYGGQVILTHIGEEVNYRIPANPGDKDAMLVELLCSFPAKEGGSLGTVYPVLLNLETGELKDVLAGTGADKLMGLCNHAISEDGSRMLLAQSDGTLYYADLAEKKLSSVEELSGEPADACSLIGDTLACWTMDRDRYRAWSIDLTTMDRKELFAGIPNASRGKESGAGIVYLSGFDTTVHRGTKFSGSHFALETDEAGNVTVINLATGEKSPVEGLFWPEDRYPDVLWESSTDGKRLLISGGEIGSKYEYIGVLDFEEKKYMEFSRKNSNEVYERKPYWFDKNTVIIPATGKDPYYAQDYYVYELLDETAVIIEGLVEKVPTILYEGKGYSIAIPEEGWIQHAQEHWVSEINETVQLWITEYTGETVDAVREQISDSGYITSEENSNLLMYTDENGLMRNVALFAEGDRIVGVFYDFPEEAIEGFGTRLAKIVSTFTWKD